MNSKENLMSSENSNRINRRNFIKAGSVGVAGLSLFKFASEEAAMQGSTSQRRIFPLNHKWLFSEKNVPGGTAPRFNDSAFTRITIPHTNKVLPWHGF